VSERLKNKSGGDTILTRESLLIEVEFTTVDDMVNQQVENVLESRQDWTRETQFVKDVEMRAIEFFGHFQPGDHLWLFRVGGGTNMRAGMVILRNDVVQHAWITAMS